MLDLGHFWEFPLKQGISFHISWVGVAGGGVVLEGAEIFILLGN